MPTDPTLARAEGKSKAKSLSPEGGSEFHQRGPEGSQPVEEDRADSVSTSRRGQAGGGGE